MIMCGKKRFSVDAFLVRKEKSNLGLLMSKFVLETHLRFVQNPLSGPIEAPHSSGIEMINCLCKAKSLKICMQCMSKTSF